ncbi:alpha-D-ribose 1-methylphosphonate 5-triphosphate synthase subunit PhnL [Rhodoligotrophos appendicifer]|uniref:phosphonate C-P lyase system protein PhnL n=1 Tax=Rhodoligotrophos appendicifer TaxID=987056 RepID=UPI00117F16BC|nr:phosphonate C-P lyase system protein PhnL [Rhodoligotrophos appendicifer]
MPWVLKVESVDKRFVLHAQDSAEIPVFRNVELELEPAELRILVGPSGAGKSSLLKLLFGTYKTERGSIRVRHGADIVDLASADPRIVLDVRRHTIGYVSQFLRVIPRVPTLDIVAEPAIEQGKPEDEARERARELLRLLNVPERLWPLSPVTFSGGEQQRVNIARGFCGAHSILLLDEPTASLDAANRERVLELIHATRRGGTAMLGIFHDEEERNELATGTLDISAFKDFGHA